MILGYGIFRQDSFAIVTLPIELNTFCNPFDIGKLSVYISEPSLSHFYKMASLVSMIVPVLLFCFVVSNSIAGPLLEPLLFSLFPVALRPSFLEFLILVVIFCNPSLSLYIGFIFVVFAPKTRNLFILVCASSSSCFPTFTTGILKTAGIAFMFAESI